MIKVALNQDNKQWDVVKGATIIATFATIAAAMAHKFELQQAGRKPRARRTPEREQVNGIGWTQSGRRAAR